MVAADAVRITRDYLGEQTPELNVPAVHVAADGRQVWAVKAAEAWKLDPCVPVQTSEGIVWVTVGVGDYLGRGNLPWMSSLLQAQDAYRWCLRGSGWERSSSMMRPATSWEPFPAVTPSRPRAFDRRWSGG